MSQISKIDSKVALGQYYTKVNPFEHPRFDEWLRAKAGLSELRFIEPFAGANNIVRMILDVFPEVSPSQWRSFDIAPEAQAINEVPSVHLGALDTLAHYPSGYDIAITNPPYLAKNSATRMGISANFGSHQDLFEVALDKMLSKTPNVAAIIPESFITKGIFQERLDIVISLNHSMFDDTEFPVCLAAFGPNTSSDFEIWRGREFIGKYSSLNVEVGKLLVKAPSRAFRFNQPLGQLGIWAIDDTTKQSIRFMHGDQISPSKVKNSSRSYSRIEHELFSEPHVLETTIRTSNIILENYRNTTQDVFLTSFKGLRSDGKYRRRIDWGTTSDIIATALLQEFPNEASSLFAPNELGLF
jgi:hypothetical protein